MRIIGGTYRGRALAEFSGKDIRPTSDRAREALFNILGGKLVGARVLDLFCGSGALGLESLSRGAREVVFNDCSADSVAVLRKNLERMKLSPKVYQKDYLACLASLKEPFDLIFLDPPYRCEYALPALEKIRSGGLLADDGIVVYERDRSFAEEPLGFAVYDERKYGKAYLTFLKQV